MLISGLVKTSLIDYPKKIAAVVFTTGCNFRCPYCHNPEVVFGEIKEAPNEKEVLEFLASRSGKLDGVVITGGEPTLQKDLEDFIRKVKEFNFSIKLDTNGSNPKTLENLLNQGLLDFVAMDIKGPLGRYKEITNSNINLFEIGKSMKLLKKSGVEFEYRTTVVKGMLSLNDFLEIKAMFEKFGYPKEYYLQKFIPSKTLDKNFMNETTPNDLEIQGFQAVFDRCKCLVR